MILGTRGSPLARGQSEWVRGRLMAAHPGLAIEVVVIRTTGDQQQTSAPDTYFGTGGAESAKGIFVKEIEDALLARRIDFAVHSLKDLPTEQPDGLMIAAIPPREDPRDALVTREGSTLADLPASARVGTSSPRRAAQLRAQRPDLAFGPVRGNVDTRIRKMMEGKFDAVVLAAAGLSRLGLLSATGEPTAHGARVSLLPAELCVPAVGQGALAIETRADDGATRSALEAIHDADAAVEVAAERAFLAALGGGCRVPVAALARARAGRVTLSGVVAAPDGGRVVRVSGECGVEDAATMGRELAGRALEQGAGAILASVESS